MKQELTFRLDVNVLWVLLLCELLHSKYLRVVVKIIEHVRVLVAAQPFIFPVKADWLGPSQVLP